MDSLFTLVISPLFFVWPVMIAAISPSSFFYVTFSILSAILLGSFDIFLAIVPIFSIGLSIHIYYSVRKKYKDYLEKFDMGYFPNEKQIPRDKFLIEQFEEEKTAMFDLFRYRNK